MNSFNSSAFNFISCIQCWIFPFKLFSRLRWSSEGFTRQIRFNSKGVNRKSFRKYSILGFKLLDMLSVKISGFLIISLPTSSSDNLNVVRRYSN